MLGNCFGLATYLLLVSYLLATYLIRLSYLFRVFFFILNIYACKHKIYNHQSYVYLICLGIKKTKKTMIKKIEIKKKKMKLKI